MEVLKEGNKLSKEYVTKCPKCGTKFIYKITNLHGLRENCLSCPICDEDVYIDIKIRYHRKFREKIRKKINVILKRSNGD